MKAYGGAGTVAPLVLTLGTRWSFTSRSPNPLEERVPLNRRLGGPLDALGGKILAAACFRRPIGIEIVPAGQFLVGIQC